MSEMKERDDQDATRAISPLRQAQDAVLIDTSHMSVEEVIQRIAHIVKNKMRKKKSMRISFRLVRWLAWLFFRLFYGLRIYGVSHLRSGAGILASNHASFFDPPVISASCREEVHFLARESLFRVPLFGRLIRALNSHPISRGSSDAHTFRQLIAFLQQGQKVILFPEGKRSSDGSIQPLERGLAFLVYKAQCTIYPVYVDGTFSVWNRTMSFPRFSRKKIRCVFGSPIEWADFSELDKRKAMEEITARAEKALHALQRWLSEGAHGDPP
jgi:1-acyl-sn-glycerol-3-phosphate acyltransferase